MSRRDEIKEQLGYLTDSGRMYLYIDIANTFGLDKESFTNRVLWVKSNISSLESLVDEADSKWEYRNAVEALRDSERNSPVEHMMYLDCTNQALQLYAVATSCSDTAYLCNLSSGNELTDAYGVIAKEMNKVSGLDIFDRNSCKKALMTTLYGKSDGETEIMSYFHENKINCALSEEELSALFQSSMRSVAPNAMLAMDKLQSLNDENIDTYYWTLPDGFQVKYDVKSTKDIEIDCKTKGGINFQFKKSVSVYKGSKYNRGIAPNIIHSIDGYVAREMVRRMTNPNPKFNRSYPAFITSIHDAFATHPNNVEEMRSHYTDLMVELNDSSILQDIMSQINGSKVFSIKRNTLLEQDIRESTYSLS